MRNNKNKTAFNETHLQNIKSKIEEKTGVQLNPNNENEAFKTVKIFRKPVAVVALMVCFVMLASAAFAIIYQTQYIPGKGFVEDGEYEVYYTPDILKLGKDAIVETVTRVKDGKTSELSIIVTDSRDKNLKIITKKHGEFNLTPAVDYNYSSFGTMGKFQFNNEGGYSSYGYYIKDFPDINEFTLVNNGESIEIKLAPSNPDEVLTAEDSGVTVRFHKMSKGSKVLAYEINENTFDFGKILGANFVGYKNIELAPWATGYYQVYDENGNEIRYNGYDESKGPDGLSTTMFLRIEREKRISRIAINSVLVTLNMHNYTYIIDDMGLPVLKMDVDDSVDIPVPKDGEEIILDDGLVLYDRNGLISKLISVKREGNAMLIYTNTEYTGNDIDNIENVHMWFSGELGSTMAGWGFNSVILNGEEDFITIQPDTVRFLVHGNWEIKFAD